MTGRPQSQIPIEMMRHGRSTSVFHALKDLKTRFESQFSRMSRQMFFLRIQFRAFAGNAIRVMLGGRPERRQPA